MKKTLLAALEPIKQKWLVHVLMYAVSLLLTTVPAVLFFQTLQQKAGNSLTISELVPEFSYMLFGDFMETHGNAFVPFFWYSLGIAYLGSVVYTFFSGGVIDELANPKRSFALGRFFKASAQYFMKYFGLLCMLGIMLFVFFLFSGIIYFIFVLLAEGSSERGYFFWLLPPSILLFIFMSFGLVVSFYAKVFMYKESRIGAVDAFWKAVSYVFKNKKTMFFFWAILVAGALLVLVYLFLDKIIGATSAFTIGVMFLFQQAIVLSKFVLKHWNYAVALDYFDKNQIELYREPPPPLEPEIDIAFATEDNIQFDEVKTLKPDEDLSDGESKLSKAEEGL